MARRKLMSIAVDFGASATKVIGICEGTIVSSIVSPEVMEIERSSLSGKLDGYSIGKRSRHSTGEYAFVGVADRYYAVGALARRFGAFQRFKPLKVESAAYKVLAATSLLADRFDLGQSFDLSLGCLLPPSELADEELLKGRLSEFLAEFDSPMGAMNVNLTSVSFHPEGAGILELYQHRHPSNLRSRVGILMAGHRNLTCYVATDGIVAGFASCDLGFNSWVKEVMSKTAGYQLETLSVALARYWMIKDIATLQPILRRQDERSSPAEIARLVEVIEQTHKIYCESVFNWLDEQFPSDLAAVMMSGGTADVLQAEFVAYFDARLPAHSELGGKAAIYSSNIGFNLPQLDVPEGYQARMADVYCLWEYLMPKPRLKSAPKSLAKSTPTK
jgi:hypothetical protein